MGAKWLTNQSSIANNEEFKLRVGIALQVVAYDILEEDEGLSNPVRKALAQRVLQSTSDYWVRFSSMVVNHPDVAAKSAIEQQDISDADILKCLLKMWNSIAGILE